MKSVTNNEFTMIVKNSKFITLLYFIHEKDEVLEKLTQAKKDYPHATHYCYAYILGGERKSSDDGEPSGTAGIPMLQVLEKNHLNQVLCIVIRYFGKIKLGAGGLVRAYTKSVVEVLKGHIVTLDKGFLAEVSFPYSFLARVDYLLKETEIISKNYHDSIIYQFYGTKELLDSISILGDEVIVCILQEVYF